MSSPLYDRCKFFIIDYACRMKLSQGTQLPSQRELCQLTAMSMITVRRAIMELEQEKYVKTISGKGVFLLRDFSEQSNAGQDEVVLFDVQRVSRNTGQISDSLRRTLNRRGCTLRAFACSETVSGEHLAAISGAIGIVFTGILNSEWKELLLTCGKPVVIVGNNNGPVEGIPTVFSTNENVPEQMISFFTGRSCKRFALLNAPESYQPSNIYQKGFERALHKRNLYFSQGLALRLSSANRSQKVYQFLKQNRKKWDCLLVQQGILMDVLSGCMELNIDPGVIGVFNQYWNENITLNNKIFYFGNPACDMELAREVLFDRMLPEESRRFHSNWIQQEAFLLPALSLQENSGNQSANIFSSK